MAARKLYLYGNLGKKLGRLHTIYVDSIAEAMRYLAANFGDTFYTNIKNGYYKIKKVNEDNISFIGEKDLTFTLGSGDLYIIPIAKGASQRSKQVGMIVAGIALAAVTFGAGIALSGVTMGAALTTTAGAGAAVAATGVVGSVTFSMSAALVLQGIAGLLTPIPKVKSRESQKENAGTSAGILNTNTEGSTIPVIYGRVKVGSVVISSGVYAEQMATNTQYSVVMNYLKEYLSNLGTLIESYRVAMTTTADSPDTIINNNSGYSYYPGKYPPISAALQDLHLQFVSLYNRAKALQEQSVNSFSLTEYTTLVDATLTICRQAEPLILGMYDTVGEVCDFYVKDDVYKVSKMTRAYIGTVPVTSFGIFKPNMRSYNDNNQIVTYHSYYASTRTANTVRKSETLTPLDKCYFMTCVMRYVLTTLKEKENW